MDKPRLNIIFDERRIERYEPLMYELERQGIVEYEIFPCIMFPDVVASINASHKMIVAEAKRAGLKETCIAEDDVMFPAEDGWEYFLSKKPNEYDLYLSGTYCVPVENKIITGFHLYMVHEKFYDTFLSVKDSVHIDTEFNNIKGDYHFCYPFAALQRPGWSNNNKEMANYNFILKDREYDVYGGLPK
jgi:hypothetical protein